MHSRYSLWIGLYTKQDVGNLYSRRSIEVLWVSDQWPQAYNQPQVHLNELNFSKTRDFVGSISAITNLFKI